MGERTRGTVWCGRVLLLAALVLGIVTMHTLGHPTSEPAPREPVRVAAVAADPADPGRPAGSAGSQEAAPHRAAAPHVMSPGATSHGDSGNPGNPDGHSDHGDHGMGMGMDPMSVCLAVLGVWTAVTLLGAAVVFALRARPHDLLAPRRARILRALWPLPPPSTSTRLARLSVLRI